MSEIEFLRSGPSLPRATFLFAHGSGAPMDTAFMNAISDGLAERGCHVARFEFDYMAARRSGGPKRPPPKMDVLEKQMLDAVAQLEYVASLFLIGKSMGGRVATLVADRLFHAGDIRGVCCLGYPFHPKGKPNTLRTQHLHSFATPALICQGTRDPLGSKTEVMTYGLDAGIALRWFEDGDHDLKPRKTITGLTHAQHLNSVCDEISGWLDDVIV